MNWKCIFSHDWKFSTENLEYSELSNRSKKRTINTPVKVCQKCYKKQRWGFGRWVDYDKNEIKKLMIY